MRHWLLADDFTTKISATIITWRDRALEATSDDVKRRTIRISPDESNDFSANVGAKATTIRWSSTRTIHGVFRGPSASAAIKAS